jgi:hypothetical protein
LFFAGAEVLEQRLKAIYESGTQALVGAGEAQDRGIGGGPR